MLDSDFPANGCSILASSFTNWYVEELMAEAIRRSGTTSWIIESP